MTVVISPAEPETFTAVGCRFTVLDDGTATGGRSGVAALELPPGWGGPPQHIHRAHDETFYVVSGTVSFTSGTDVLYAKPGQVVTAPIGDPHTFGNPDSDEPATLVVTLSPEKYLDYFRELAAATRDADGPLAPDVVLGIMARYATEPYRG